jgi:hypothetical protein
MRGFSLAIIGFIAAGLARGQARLFSAKTISKKITKQV